MANNGNKSPWRQGRYDFTCCTPDCTKRSPTCHATCKDYNDQTKELRRQKEQERKYLEIHNPQIKKSAFGGCMPRKR